jgi:hypothetical protein
MHLWKNEGFEFTFLLKMEVEQVAHLNILQALPVA